MDCLIEVAGMHDGICQILLGRHPLIIVSDIKETERVLLKSKATVLSKRVNQAFDFVMPEGQISIPANEVWKKHRRLAGPSMSKRYLERMLSRINASATNLVKFWNAKMDITGSCAFEASLDIHLAAVDNTINLTMGFPLGSIELAHASLPTEPIQSDGIAHIPRPNTPPLYEAISTLVTSVGEAVTSPFPWLHGRLVKYISPSWRKGHRLLCSFLNSKISEAREQESLVGEQGNGLATDADCIVDMIVQHEAREAAEALGEAGIRDELISFIFSGGQDTTSAVLRWLVKYLTNDAEIQRRLHNEVCTVFAKDIDEDAPLDFNLLNDSDQVPLLEAVIAETLRCAGVGSQVLRERTQLMFAMALMSRDKSEWGPDADEWRPTRWLTSKGVFDRSAGPSFPFGMGQRSCFGQRLGVLQLKTFATILSQNFFFKPVPAEVSGLEAFETLTKQPKHCYVSLERWEQREIS
ncbi:unnamed protein product [Rhizoctonia solani]|uniref:Uncharacterized protein n=1 Tax=Rhizoctonia solani TaxID=456999 RepID=A0A8H2XXN1_9AGAM|nr:unnamed protein product [Rhizoctonia solani]